MSRVSQVPQPPQLPQLPEARHVPQALQVPQVPQVPQASEVPQSSQVSEAPNVCQVPQARRSHRSPRAIAIRVGEMAACSDWVAPGDGALSGEAREAPEARHHIRRPLRLELRIEWHCCSPAPPTLILRVVTSPRADREKKIRSPFQCARPLSILRSGVGGRIASCRAAQVVQTFFFQPFEQDEQTQNMMLVFATPYESTSGPQ